MAMKYKKKQELAKLLKSKPSFNVVTEKEGVYNEIGSDKILSEDQLNEYDLCLIVKTIKDIPE
jgi:hypothetical protein